MPFRSHHSGERLNLFFPQFWFANIYKFISSSNIDHALQFSIAENSDMLPLGHMERGSTFFVSLPSRCPCSILVNATPPGHLQFAIALPLQAVTLSIVEEFAVTSLTQYRPQCHTATLPPKSHSIAIVSSLSIIEEFAVTLPLQYLASHAALRLPYNRHCKKSLSSLSRSSPLASTLQAVTLSIVEEFSIALLM